jgi:phosphotransferase system  glucose/maltose/N-acetylglucosamine-specific IIC component
MKEKIDNFIEYYNRNININVEPFEWFNYGVIYTILYTLMQKQSPAWVLFFILLISVASFLNAGILYYIRNIYIKTQEDDISEETQSEKKRQEESET